MKSKKMYRYSISINMRSVCVLLLLFIGNGFALHPDFGLNITELVTKYGYPIESHEVQTDDGYILTLHRIPHGKTNDRATKGPIFLNHGILSNSMDWVNMGPNKSLGFLLADAGYDLWMGNARGNRHSRKHITLDPDSDPKNFFAFSFHEIGVYDLPASIDHVLESTGAESLNFIGHSQGTTSFFIMAAEKPEYNAKIKLMAALAPVAYMEHIQHPIVRILKKYPDSLTPIFEALELYEILPYTKSIENLAGDFCSEESSIQEICGVFILAIGGFDSAQLDRNSIPLMGTSDPAGSAKKQALHYYQEIISGNFAQYDYGEGNMEHYGQDTPPQYDTSKITAPVILHYAQKDWFASPIDVERLAGELPNLVALKLVDDPDFSHLDYIIANDIVELLNGEIMSEFDEVNSLK